MPLKSCPACDHFDAKTVDRLLGLGYSPRYISRRFIVLSRRVLTRHKDVCLPPKLEEVHADLMRLGGGGA